MASRRKYSLRRHVWRVVALIALVPLLFLTLGIPFDHFIRWKLVGRTEQAVVDCVERVDAGESCATAADLRRSWIRVYRDGELVEDADGGTPASVSRLERLMEPKAKSWLRKYDPVPDAPSAGNSKGCAIDAFDRLLVCHRVKETMTDGDRIVVVAVAGDIRSVRALSFDGVTKLALQVLVVALLVGWWLGRRIVIPIETLRNSVLERRGTSSLRPIPADDETEVGEVAAAFNELLTEVDDRRRRNEAFAADLAHDLKTPVATVLSCAENIETTGALSDEEARRYAAVLRRSGERLNSILGDFLDLARAEAGLERMPRERVDVAELLAAVVDELSRNPEFEGRRVETELGSGEILASPGHIQTAFENVIVNALQVVGSVGIVRVTVTTVGAAVMVRVEDDGPGIPADDLPQVFDRFFTRRSGGTGLGLPMARAIARAHGGELTVDSKVDAGSTFEFRLPSHDSHIQMTDE